MQQVFLGQRKAMLVTRSFGLTSATLALLFATALYGIAQQPASQPQQPASPPPKQPAPAPPINLVMPTGTGRIVIPASGLQWKGAHLYANTTRYVGPGYWSELQASKPGGAEKTEQPPLNPVFEFAEKASGLQVSYILFPSVGDSASAQACRNRDAATAFPLLAPLAGTIDSVNKENITTAKGRALAAATYLFRPAKGSNEQGKEVDGFLASSSSCAEIRVAKIPYVSLDDPAFSAQLNSFAFEPNYTPTVQDYFGVGTIFYRLKSYATAAIYFQRALDTLPDAAPVNARRVLTDQLSIALAMSGQFERNRALNEAAIKTDADYPIYYYNLARADALQGDVANAKLHLRQTFAHEENLPAGEQMPDPINDESFAKLRDDPSFSAFVESLQ
jgi:tetratricopeptide (TPR) repeat protein